MAEQKRVNLEGRSVFIGIPTYDGKLNIKLAYTLAALMPVALQHGVSVKLGHVSGCSIITMARNSLVDQFLKSDCTELLFIDADVIPTVDDIMRILAQSTDRHLTAGMYPRRAKDRKFFLDFYLDDNDDLVFDGAMMRVNRVGTGFMWVARHVVEKIASCSATYLGPDGAGQIANVFEFSMMDGKFVGEDYNFCDKVGMLGYEAWVDVEICLPHIGTEEFTNDFKNEVVVPLIDSLHKAKLKVVNG